MAPCPECNAQILISEDVHVGEVLICSDCQTQWEVINREPLEFALAPEIEEDWGE